MSRYHHGNLKKTLLDAALTLIAKQGPRAFTLREVARQAEVSHNAPYRHFHDKEELLAAVAAEGFERLAESMIQASVAAHDPMEKLLLCGRGYVQFALAMPQHFSVMFDQSDGFAAYPQYAESGRRAFEVLLHAIGGALPAGDSNTLALTAWSMVHGIAKLAVSGLLPFKGDDAVLEFTNWATHALAGGLNNVSAARPPSANPLEISCNRDR